MSKKREDPPPASSSEEEVSETRSGEDDESSSEGEDVVSSRKPSAVTMKPVVALAAPSEKQQVSDSESGSDEESDDSDSEPENVETKPPLTQSKDSSVLKNEVSDSESEAEKKDDAVTKPTNQDSKKVKSSENSVAKRARETDEGVSSDVKKVKKVVSASPSGEEEKKKSCFQRVWTDNDEIAVLQGLLDFRKDTGVSPYDNTNTVYQLVKKNISFDVSKVQFMEKLRSLKKKYENNLGKAAKNGDDPTFAKPHDRKAFELSKLAWGAIEKAIESAVKSNGKSKQVACVKHEHDSSLVNAINCQDLSAKSSSLVRTLTRFGVDELAAQQGLDRLTSEDKKSLEEQWKALQVREFDFYSQKTGFVHQVLAKMAEAFRSNA
ncbi:hypothetical protein CARUB_v10015438mg [Capsella rubella]|uniref:Uncharacterized protein n=1 Tax=Capsella rubella TaxID=81985 RepID=R0G954_9BRAS|nr:hypothetical protein CARUB_v10015438mg [Capsella rubella]